MPKYHSRKNDIVLGYSGCPSFLLKCDNPLASHIEKVTSLLHTYFYLTVRCTLRLVLPTLCNIHSTNAAEFITSTPEGIVHWRK